MDRKVKVRVKGLCGSNEPSRATIPPSSSGVEFERMEMDARALHGLEWSESSTWLAGGCGMAWFFFLFQALRRPFFRVASEKLVFLFGLSCIASANNCIYFRLNFTRLAPGDGNLGATRLAWRDVAIRYALLIHGYLKVSTSQT